mmetsp:Transcript_16201/g.56583  ORF Transcript_16201/g.56583 Transcript_16201/m.56583 type:complete len:244 (-) Transcript_16201:109-840(-)
MTVASWQKATRMSFDNSSIPALPFQDSVAGLLVLIRPSFSAFNCTAPNSDSGRPTLSSSHGMPLSKATSSAPSVVSIWLSFQSSPDKSPDQLLPCCSTSHACLPPSTRCTSNCGPAPSATMHTAERAAASTSPPPQRRSYSSESSAASGGQAAPRAEASTMATLENSASLGSLTTCQTPSLDSAQQATVDRQCPPRACRLARRRAPTPATTAEAAVPAKAHGQGRPATSVARARREGCLPSKP